MFHVHWQSTPFTYRFAYVIGSSANEVPLVAHAQLANSLANVVLPAGPAPLGTISLVVYVTDVFGAVARGAVDTDRVSAAVVSVTPPNVTSETLVNYTLSQLADVNNGQQSSGDEVARLGAVSAVVVGSLFPCGYVTCGLIGRCVRGGCFCPTLTNGTTSSGVGRIVYVPAPRNDSTACNGTSISNSTGSLYAIMIVRSSVKQCPGSGIELDTTGVPISECSGHGACIRGRSLCLDNDAGCTAYCNCSLGWTGTACSQSEAQALSTRELQLTLLSTTVRPQPFPLHLQLLHSSEQTRTLSRGVGLCSRPTC